MTRSDFTYIAIVLDRSGSMDAVRSDTIGGFNSFIAQHRKTAGKNLLTLVQFDSEYQVVHEARPIAEVPELTIETYVPRGSTALIDAIGRTIDRTGSELARMREGERPARVMICVITDGQENSSSEYVSPPWRVKGVLDPVFGPIRGGNKFDRVQKMIAHQRGKYSWDFVFLGANEDGIAQAAGQMGFGHVYAYTAGPVGTQQVFGAVSSSMGGYMRGGGFNAADAPGIRAVVTPESSKGS